MRPRAPFITLGAVLYLPVEKTWLIPTNSETHEVSLVHHDLCCLFWVLQMGCEAFGASPLYNLQEPFDHWGLS